MTFEFAGIGETADILGLSRTSIQKLVDIGKLAAIKTHGGHRRILRSSIEEMNQKMGPKALARLTSPPCTSQVARAPAYGAPSGASDAPVHVLIVEEDTATANALLGLFTSRYPQVTCIVAADGLNAVLQLERTRPRLLIASLRKDPIDGFRLINMVRSRAEYSGIATVALSSLSAGELNRRSDLPPEVMFLPTPLRLERLSGFVDAHVLPARLGEPSPVTR